MEEKYITPLEFIIHPGETVGDLLKDRNITPKELADKIGVDESNIKELIEGKINIDAGMANDLEMAFNIEASFWIGLQASYDKEMKEYLKSKSR